MKVLHVTPSFYPAVRWGGPIFSTKSLCDIAARDLNYELHVLTTSAAGPDWTDNLKEGGQLVPFEAGYSVRYCRRILAHSISIELLFRLPDAIRKCDVVHLTGTYSFPTVPTMLCARLLGKPVVWSPRGALQATEEWMASPRRRSKRLFEKLVARLRPSRMLLMVTSEDEAKASIRNLPNTSTFILPNIVDLPLDLPEKKRAGMGLRLMFLSRLHVKKGVELLLDVMKLLPPNVILDIYGDGDPSYVDNLKEMGRELGSRVTFHGHVEGEAKSNAFRNADIFVLPSYSENFGIVIAEALAHGVPVVTTDTTPWKRLDINECGRCVPAKVETILDAICDLAGQDLQKAGELGRLWVAEEFSSDAVTLRLAQAYSDVKMEVAA